MLFFFCFGSLSHTYTPFRGSLISKHPDNTPFLFSSSITCAQNFRRSFFWPTLVWNRSECCDRIFFDQNILNCVCELLSHAIGKSRGILIYRMRIKIPWKKLMHYQFRSANRSPTNFCDVAPVLNVFAFWLPPSYRPTSSSLFCCVKLLAMVC